MPNKKPTETKERAAVGKERRLALALRAVLDAAEDDDIQLTVEQMEAGEGANALLAELGYADLEAIPTAIKRLTTELAAATEAGEWSKVSELAHQLDRAKLGLPPSKPKSEKGKAVGGEG